MHLTSAKNTSSKWQVVQESIAPQSSPKIPSFPKPGIINKKTAIHNFRADGQLG